MTSAGRLPLGYPLGLPWGAPPGYDLAMGTNHSNRNRDADSPYANPRPEEIQASRAEAGMTQAEAAEVVLGSVRTWQKWEQAERRMHPGLWLLWQLRTRDRRRRRAGEAED